jgi:hypothetical protein
MPGEVVGETDSVVKVDVVVIAVMGVDVTESQPDSNSTNKSIRSPKIINNLFIIYFLY